MHRGLTSQFSRVSLKRKLSIKFQWQEMATIYNIFNLCFHIKFLKILKTANFHNYHLSKLQIDHGIK